MYYSGFRDMNIYKLYTNIVFYFYMIYEYVFLMIFKVILLFEYEFQ